MKSYIELIKENIIRFNANIKRFIGGRYVLTWLDEIFSFIVFGASPDDYFRYEFYKKSWFERNKFITYRRGKRLNKKYNEYDADTFRMLNDKSLMYQRFKGFIMREWVDFDKCSVAEFAEFFEKNGRVMIKPKNGSCGRGVLILNEMPSDLEQYKGCIAEQVIDQHPTISKLNASSVNSLRVLTFKGELISCVLKVGRGDAIVDNMHANGMYGNVNLETGIIDSPFYDIERNVYMQHPTSGEILIGVEIPHWDKIKAFVAEASKLMPQAEYIGWDVALLPDGPAIIEANESPGHYLSCQSTVQEGINGKIKELEREKRAI